MAGWGSWVVVGINNPIEVECDRLGDSVQFAKVVFAIRDNIDDVVFLSVNRVSDDEGESRLYIGGGRGHCRLGAIRMSSLARTWLVF